MKPGDEARGAGLAPRKGGPAAACPICARPALESFRPFCCKRCADIDLARWLSGRYAIPGEPVVEEGDKDDDKRDGEDDGP